MISDHFCINVFIFFQKCFSHLNIMDLVVIQNVSDHRFKIYILRQFLFYDRISQKSYTNFIKNHWYDV